MEKQKVNISLIFCPLIILTLLTVVLKRLIYMYQMYAHAVTAIFSFHIVQAKEKEE